ncbi:hypothetical protein ACJ6WF_27255 [Streptomyces sp. MMS24-I2-30]|uniref:hypothetical protein n=1 Tax=Streptomyces sp. MMS24-I2-30 TaxID=3351564 RepID=UPI003896ED2E
MCGACGTGTVRPPWEVVLAGDRPADRRRRAAAAAEAAGGRVGVAPWGAAGYLVTPRTGPPRHVPDLDRLAACLLPHLRRHHPLPECPACPHEAERHRVGLPADPDPQRLAVWAALAGAHGGAGRLRIEIHVPRAPLLSASATPEHPSDDAPVRVRPGSPARPAVVLCGPHAVEYADHLRRHLSTVPRRDASAAAAG